MIDCFSCSFFRRRILACLGLVLLGSTPVLAQQDTEVKEAPVPKRIAEAIKQAQMLQAALKFPEALQLLQQQAKALGQSITTTEKRALRIATADLHFNWAKTEHYFYHWQGAISHYLTAYEIDKAERKKNAALDLNMVGMVYSAFGENSKALEFLKRALPLFKQVKDLNGEANTLYKIGIVYDNFGEKAKALEFYNKALPILEKKNHVLGILDHATVLNLIGMVYAGLGENPKALEYFYKSLPFFQKIRDKSGEADVLQNIGFVHNNRGEKIKALEFYNKAIMVQRQSGDKKGESSTLSNVAAVYNSLNENTKALSLYNRALLLQKEISDKKTEAKILNGMGKVYSDLGESIKALEFLNRALPLRRQVGDKTGEAITLENLLHVWSNKNFKDNNIGIAIIYGKQAVNTLQSMRNEIKKLSKDTQKSFTRIVENTYRALADILIEQGRLPEAQQVLRLLKDQEFEGFARRSDNLSSGKSQVELTPLEKEAKKKQDAVLGKIAAIAAEYELLKKKPKPDEKQLRALEAQLDAAQAAFLRTMQVIAQDFKNNAGASNKLITLQETENLNRALLALSDATHQNTIAVSVFPAENRLNFIVQTGNVQVAREYPIKVEELNKLVARFRRVLEDPRLDPLPLAKTLYDILVGPIQKDIAGADAKNILWSLDGTLRYIPLAALSPDGKRYWIEDGPRSSLFTPATLLNIALDPKPANRALALGVTQARKVEDLEFNALPGVQEELKGIAGTLPTQTLLDDQFTQDAFRQELRSGPPLVHIASHFAFKPQNPTDSFLLLGKGTLSLGDIASSRVSLFAGVELLTLSACDTATGSGKHETGAEVESFALLAQKKGAGAVLATLWPVNDTSTQALMQAFYKRRKTDTSLTKTECLRLAQLDLLQGRVKPSVTKRGAPESGLESPAFTPDPNAPAAHPYYWAPFVLVGNTR